MNRAVLIIGNSNHTLMYSASLRGYGYEVEDTRSFDTAIDWLATGHQPECIIIDVRGMADTVRQFVHEVREADLKTNIVVIGTRAKLPGVDITMPRTMEATDLIDTLRHDLKIA